MKKSMNRRLFLCKEAVRHLTSSVELSLVAGNGNGTKLSRDPEVVLIGEFKQIQGTGCD
jgi:hypothetical protein